MRKVQPSLFSLQYDTPPFSKTLIKEPRRQKQKITDRLQIKISQCTSRQEQPTIKSKRESYSLTHAHDSGGVTRSHQWKSIQKQNFITPRIQKSSPFVDPESNAQPYQGPLRYGKFLVRVFDGNFRQVRPKSACRLKPTLPRTIHARKSVILSKPLCLTPGRINNPRKSLRSEDLTLQALKQLSSEPKYPPIKNTNISFTDLFQNFLKKMEKINTNQGPNPKQKKGVKNLSLSNRGSSSYNASIDSTKVSITSRVCPPNSETMSIDGNIDSGRMLAKPKPTLIQKSKIERSFRKAIKSEFKQIIENSPLLGSGESKKKKPTHRRVKSNGNDVPPPKIVIIGTKSIKPETTIFKSSPKTENIQRFTSQDRRKIRQILKIGKTCEVDLSKVNLSKRQKPYQLAKNLEREIRQKADIHNPVVRQELINLNRVCLTLSDEKESIKSSELRTITLSSNDSDFDDFFEKQLLYN